jgi:hypothetical protein
MMMVMMHGTDSGICLELQYQPFVWSSIELSIVWSSIELFICVGTTGHIGFGLEPQELNCSLVFLFGRPEGQICKYSNPAASSSEKEKEGHVAEIQESAAAMERNVLARRPWRARRQTLRRLASPGEMQKRRSDAEQRGARRWSPGYGAFLLSHRHVPVCDDGA